MMSAGIEWLDRQAEIAAQRLLEMDPSILSPVGRSILPLCEAILEVPDNVINLDSRRT